MQALKQLVSTQSGVADLPLRVAVGVFTMLESLALALLGGGLISLDRLLFARQ